MPGLAPGATPGALPDATPDSVPEPVADLASLGAPAVAAPAVTPVAAPGVGADATMVLPPMPLDPPDLPPVAAPAAVLAPVAAALPIPDPPARPPAVPAPSTPAGPPVPVVEPLFAHAPGLNWAGPGDLPQPPAGGTPMSRAWALQALGDARPAQVAAPAPDLRNAAGQPPTARDIELIRTSLAVVEPVADRATAHFYALIFLHHPEIRALFPAAMDVQRDRLFRALLMAARSAGDPEGLRTYLSALGRGHRRYGTLTGHYGPVGECLVQALARYAGSRWDAETELAWRRVYRLVSSIMIDAAEEAARTSPPWWQGEVVAHELRTRDVAVLTVRPDQPYPYRAGQYAGLETPWWPRVWRHFSFASAPRPDGLLTFHVKAVQAGWVSNALVHRAAPGDVLRLGPAAGAMTVDHAAGADLLCLGGGTGIAPIRALVEEVAAHGAAGRSVEVFYGARQAGELYELEALRELAGHHPWLSVRPVLSGPGASGSGALAGELPEVVGRFGPWAGREAYLSGPAAMVRRGVGVLLRAGVTADRIRHDLVGDLAAG
ncbi:globin domain-containing protein [Kitasatospora sp. NPDC050467]|uniref:globin domain-containing protein n=1 Tax=Kitasatospora sp. NPDC050467 TaxID=3364053 RepID=UPI0037AFF208